ncbi:OmpA family protein [Seohaeicola zhoushanensis]|uniref:Membrane protein n=1 Tax=Seohaeicola zhoushanensis TaxID=1569283 RepID=A0A8J3GWF9_9RHOB|nr:OmpA family protein [Seohaeicola zhoushanensis]GHF43090.1 membrane protein [Seohaeicola zhoushanensis]
MTLKTPILAAIGATLFLTACNDPVLNDPENRNRNQGALIGSGVGAALGQLIGKDSEATIAGAAIGGIAGGLIGSSLDKQEAELRASMNNGTITNTGDRLIVTLPQDILFATDSYAVRSDLQRDLGALASNLRAYPNSTVQVVGHTDNTGDAAYNQDLSERRASSVGSVLINSGVAAGRIQIVGRGEDAPIASNLTPEGRARNRRVEVVIIPTR